MKTNLQSNYSLIAYPLDALLPFSASPLILEPTFQDKEKFGWGYNFTSHQQHKKAIIAIIQLKRLHAMHYKTFSILNLNLDIAKTFGYYYALKEHCNLIYFRSPKPIEKSILRFFIKSVLIEPATSLYFEDSVLDHANISRTRLLPPCLPPDSTWYIH